MKMASEAKGFMIEVISMTEWQRIPWVADSVKKKDINTLPALYPCMYNLATPIN